MAGGYGEGEEWQAGESRRWERCPVYLHMSRNVPRTGRETLDGGVSPPAGSCRPVGTHLLAPGCFPRPGSSFGHNGLWIFVEMMSSQRV